MPPAPTRIGLQIPDFNLPEVESAGLLDKLAEIAMAAESSGFDSIWVMDHLNQISLNGPMENWMLEGNTVLAALTARTRSVDLGLMVGGVTYRNPALMAKITTSIDVLSGGRAVMGLGAAWAGAEHLAFGFPFPPLKERFERLEEAVQIFRAMFTQDQPSCAGTHDEIREILNRPAPIRGDIPIMIGGSGERKTHRLVAQYADASNLFGDPEEIRHLVGVLNDHCATVGRDPAEITKTRLGGLILRDRHADALAAKAQFLADHPHQTESLVTAGDATAVAEQVQALLDAGPDGLIFSMPEVHDTEQVKAAGRLLCELVT